MISLLGCLGIFLSLLNFEVMLFVISETKPVKKLVRKIKNRIRHFFWYYFDYKNDFIEK